jgi:hypothetical protein
MITTQDPGSSNHMLAAALTAAGRGWHVFPLRHATKVPALHGARCCPRLGSCADGHVGWEQRATIDPDRIRSAWSAGQFNIGIATGPSTLVVIDLDTAKPDDGPRPAEWDVPGVRDGQDVLAVLADRHDQPVPADTFTVATPSGGLHLYFRAPVDAALRNTAGTLGWKMDTRAHGGYVAGPASSVDGVRYRVVLDVPVAPLPGWLVALLCRSLLPAAPDQPVRVVSGRRSRYLDAAMSLECQKVHDAAKGQRNATLYAAAVALGQLVAGKELAEHEVTERLLTAAGRHIAVGAYSEHQARATIASGLQRGANRPRRVA